MARADRLEFVQGLRGVAAVAVMLYHARVFIDGPAYDGLGTRLFGAGHTGVDLFFVISGLIMVHTTRQVAGTPRAALAFLVRRFARIWPVYAVLLATAWVVTRPISPPAYVTDPAALARALVFYPQDAHAAAPFFGYPPLLHAGWTLVYEIYFYLCFGVALATRRWRYLTLAAIGVAGLIAWPLAATGGLGFDARAGYGLEGYACIATSPIVWEFGLGVVIGLIRERAAMGRDRRLLAGLVVLAVGAVLAQIAADWHVGHGPSRSGIPLAVMVLAIALYDRARPIGVPRWLAWLGDVSFSLYLVHILPHVLLRVVPRLLGYPVPTLSGVGFFVGVLVAGVALAYVSHRWLERGLAEWVRRRLVAWTSRLG